MLQEALQPQGSGIWWALGLVLVHFVLGGVLLWTPESIRPILRSRPSSLWFAYVFMGWQLTCIVLMQFSVPDHLPRTMQADIANNSATIVSCVGGLAIALGVVLFVKEKWSYIGLRNFAVAFSLALCAFYVATLLQQRAVTYLLIPPGARTALYWDVSTYRHLLVGLLISTGTVLERTIRLAHRERKARDEAFRTWPIPTLGVFEQAHKIDAGWLSWHRRQTKAWMKRPRCSKGTWWEWLLPLIAMFPSLGMYYPPPDVPEEDDKPAG